jgi:dTMP kinase
MSLRGKFITIEGVEGVGKTTNIAFIKDWLTQNNIPYLTSREPGGTPIAEEIRQILLNPRDEAVCNKTELLLMFAARAQHLEEVILPQLNNGNWVLCDRFTDATYAYQGAGRNMDSQLISQLESMIQGTLRPDLTLILDIPPKEGLKRANQRGSLDRFEQEKIEFFERVRECYQLIAKRDPKRCVVIDASLSLSKVQVCIKEALETFYNDLQVED